jgi:hypothetical protein
LSTRTLTGAAVAALVAALILPATASAAVDLKSRMSGEQVVGGQGAPEGNGRATFDVKKRKNKFCFDVTFHRIGHRDGLDIGIYAGKAGQNGNEVIDLVDKPVRSPVSGCAKNFVPRNRLEDIKEHPQSYHINIKNNSHSQSGTIRGQLKRP